MVTATSEPMHGAVTVIVPTFQRAPLLRECLNSVMPQLEDADRVIVVSDGSTDDTSTVARGFGERVEVIERENGGFPLAANEGLRRVETEYSWVIGDDDQILPGALNRFRTHMDNHPECQFSISTWEAAARSADGGPLQSTGWAFPLPDLRERGVLPPLFESNYISGAVMFARAKLFRELDGFDPRYTRSQDYHLAIRAALRAPFDVLPGGPVYLYARHAQPRGKKGEQFPVELTRQKWLTYDQWIYHELISPLPLTQFVEPDVDGDAGEALAWINRARAAASKLLAVQCLDSLVTRCLQFPDVRISDREHRRLHDILTLGGWYQLGGLNFDRTFWDGVRSLSQLSPAGREVRSFLEARRMNRIRRAAMTLRHGY